MNDFRLRPENRLRRRSDFEEVYALRQRMGDGHLLVFGRRNPDDIRRIGLSVSKKHGNAVERARIKRLLREAFRLSQQRLPAYDLILIPRQNSGATLDDFSRSLVRLAKRIDKRYGSPSA